jgi:23S rRNA pseudouridine2604 synthase
MELIRLNKYLKDTGICSRRKADEFIANGHIKVNGRVITELGYKINLQTDKVEVLPEVNNIISEFKYIVLNKPKGYVCSKSDLDGKTIFELVPNIENLTYAGRLDKDSQGLIILSNDGKFVYNVAGNEFNCEKEYLVRVDKIVTPEYLYQQSCGNIRLNGKAVRPAKTEYVSDYLYNITLTEGMNRQIRRMAENQGYKVTQLKRLRIGTITDHNISLGKWRYLTHDEIKSLIQTKK